MRHKAMRLLAALLGTVVLGQLPGCEEVLEVCQPCGSLLNGEITISGDPRIDGTFDAVRRVEILAREAQQAYDADLAALRQAFGAPADATASQLAAEIKAQLFDNPDFKATLGIEPAECWIDAAFAEDTEIGCEERSECNVSDSCRASGAPVSCIGYYAGACGGGAEEPCSPDAGACAGAVCSGRCFVEAGNALCADACIGLCAEIDSLACPGLCSGRCSGGCSAYDASGACAGYCEGLCTGSCDATSPFSCNGRCLGRCELPIGGAGQCPGECRGSCLAADGRPVAESGGKCRGHVRPLGCDEGCADCREMAKLLAWSAMTCEPARATLGISFPEGFSGDRNAAIRKARAYERVLARALHFHSRLALLVDGSDGAGALLASALDPSPFAENRELAYLDDPQYVQALRVAEGSKYLPLFNLKARVGMLFDTASSGDFMIAAGSLSCVAPALGEAKAVLDQMIPVVEANGALAPDRSCPATDAGVSEPCLYRLVDGYGILIDPVR